LASVQSDYSNCNGYLNEDPTVYEYRELGNEMGGVAGSTASLPIPFQPNAGITIIDLLYTAAQSDPQYSHHFNSNPSSASVHNEDPAISDSLKKRLLVVDLVHRYFPQYSCYLDDVDGFRWSAAAGAESGAEDFNEEDDNIDII